MKGRQSASVVLLVAGLLCLLTGTITLYLRAEVFSADKIADKATKTLDNSEVRDAASKKITDELIEKVDPNLVTAKPLIEAGTAAVIDSGAFKGAFHKGVEDAYRAAINGDDSALVTVSNVGVLVDQALQQFQPKLAKKIPKGLDTTLIKIGEGGIATDAAQTAEKLRLLGLVLPPLGLLLLCGSVAVAPDRRRGVIWAGGGTALTALVAVLALFVTHDVIAAGIDDSTDKGAFNGVWEVFVNPLRNWFIGVGAFGLIVASAASSALRTRDLGGPISRVWRWFAVEPDTTRKKVFWALRLALVGMVMVLDPVLALRVLIIVAGAYLLSLAIATIVSLAEEPMSKAQSKTERRRILAWTAGGIGAAIVAGAVLVAVLGGGAEKAADEVDVGPGCNGSEALCNKHIDEVAFAATHNSYAGANYPGFVFPEQDNTIPQQLDAGVRGLWIDTYYGVPGKRVYTDTSKVDPALIAMVNEELGPKFTAAAARIRAQIAKPPANAKTKIYLCHGFCELGAVDAEDTFVKIREFLDEHPNEVLIIDLEDYTTPADTQKSIDDAGLTPYIYKGPQGPPWPTLQEMIDSGGRVLLVSEHMTNDVPWYRPLESTIQETPFEFPPADSKSPKDMTCKGGRGERSTTLFLINHWIGTDPTPKPTNAQKVNAHDFLLERAKRCERQRGRFPNVLNVDFYLQGDLFGVIDELNGNP